MGCSVAVNEMQKRYPTGRCAADIARWGAAGARNRAGGRARAWHGTCTYSAIIKEDKPMAQCMTCGNNYERIMEVTLDGRSYTFDCFECAIHELAPLCSACGCRILGHGVQSAEQMFCSAHCARQHGVEGITTHVGEMD
jgi:hypothetical protein